MEDEAGGDEKIIAVPSSKLTQRYDKVKSYSDLPDITLQQIQAFLRALQGSRARQMGQGAAAGATPTRRTGLIAEGIEAGRRKKKIGGCGRPRGGRFSSLPACRKRLFLLLSAAWRGREPNGACGLTTAGFGSPRYRAGPRAAVFTRQAGPPSSGRPTAQAPA